MGQDVKMVSVTEPEFRDALARWGSGVTVVTARAGDEPVGMTVASFSSLSLDPPLVLACIAHSATSHDGLVESPGFAVHLLGSEQEELSTAFARPGPEKFDEHPTERGPSGSRCWPSGSPASCAPTTTPCRGETTPSSSAGSSRRSWPGPIR